MRLPRTIVNSIDEISSSSLLDIDAIRPKLKTEPDTAFFWSEEQTE